MVLVLRLGLAIKLLLVLLLGELGRGVRRLAGRLGSPTASRVAGEIEEGEGVPFVPSPWAGGGREGGAGGGLAGRKRRAAGDVGAGELRAARVGAGDGEEPATGGGRHGSGVAGSAGASAKRVVRMTRQGGAERRGPDAVRRRGSGPHTPVVRREGGPAIGSGVGGAAWRVACMTN
uniref:DUF834 domain-containing protein n=1 Tax=Setaria viridis TaxID=4556 RepID=A0A4U6TKU5_SETVI|nr:hypothetical protein SEVIR_7G004700v2 [Setaria viridis]